LALCVQIYLRIDRVDLAQKVLKSMQDLDDDDSLTTLAQVWVALAQVSAAPRPPHFFRAGLH
jgi:coatomer subunit epsilon